MATPNKQHGLRAASFKRIAKSLRVCARNHKKAGNPLIASTLAVVATELDQEAKTLRAMR